MKAYYAGNAEIEDLPYCFDDLGVGKCIEGACL